MSDVPAERETVSHENKAPVPLWWRRFLPNTLTGFRICVIPILVWLLTFPGKAASAAAGLVFLAASVTDFFDGYLARRYHVASTLGKLLDPLADKLITVSALIMCQRCHYKDNPAGAPSSDAYVAYDRSVHGRALAAGNPKAPICQSCHGGHDIQHAHNPNSSVAKGRVAVTCGACHLEEYSKYRSSVHGTALYDQNITDAPDCTGCHGEHAIMAPSNPFSPVAALNVARTCASCHGDKAIMARYGIGAQQVETFEESFHGIGIRFGSKRVANCASCHGTHDIRPPDDPASSVNVANIPRTCGKCHPGANPNYAKGKMHVDPRLREAGVVYWVASFFKYLTLLTIAGLILHIVLDLWRRFRGRRLHA